MSASLNFLVLTFTALKGEAISLSLRSGSLKLALAPLWNLSRLLVTFLLSSLPAFKASSRLFLPMRLADFNADPNYSSFTSEFLRGIIFVLIGLGLATLSAGSTELCRFGVYYTWTYTILGLLGVISPMLLLRFKLGHSGSNV